ncbi:Fis family transcriptional regulator [Photobacterium gaetbulicola]|uniref:Fis family transcriptional regulator n=1 Tax=Photobacterium gaetbulicola TaxID=1295392 RepID=A0A0B9GXJ1_9GAMM|nr:MMPL family transporter [Photobacterium gaetbulicola]KHT63471.1 Fis family transcriptional regulator [Photobacterium gaetbulicola]
MKKWTKPRALFALLAWLCIMALAFLGLGKLSLNNDYKVFFSEDNPDLIAFEMIEEKYNSNDSVLVVLHPKSGDVFQEDVLRAVFELTEYSWQTPYSYRVDSLTNYQYTRAQSDELIVEDFVTLEELTNSKLLEEKKAYALKQPELVDRYLARDANSTAINVLVRLTTEGQSEEVREIAQFWQAKIIEAQARYPEVQFYLTGQVMQNDAFGEATQRDMGSLVPSALLLIVVGTGIYLRSLWGAVVVTLTIISSIFIALGAAGWLGMAITSPSASAPLIILTMAVADCIHYLQGYKHALNQGEHKLVALRLSMEKHRLPIILTSLTTAVGFLSMNFSDSPPFNDLGNITAMGVISAMFLTLFFVPALLAILPARRSRVVKRQGLERILEAIARWALVKPGLKIALIIVGGGVIAANLVRNDIDDTLFEYFDESYAVRQANDFTYANLTGIASIQFAIRPEMGEVVTSPDFLHKLDRFVKQARETEGVYHIQSLTDIMKRLNSSLHNDVAEQYRLPTDPALSAQILLLYDMSLPYGLNLSNQVSLDKKELRIIVTAKKMSSNDLIALESTLRSHLLGFFPESSVSPGVSADIMFAHIGYRNNVSMLTASVVALLVISLLIGLILRSVRLGVISILPNILPASVAFGLWGLGVGEVGLSLSVIASMTLGIVVDDTIHLLYRYHSSRKAGKSEEESIASAVKETGVAIIGTTIVLSAGFFVLASSSFKMNADMGLMTAITLIIALVLDLLLIPVLLKVTGKSTKVTQPKFNTA